MKKQERLNMGAGKKISRRTVLAAGAATAGMGIVTALRRQIKQSVAFLDTHINPPAQAPESRADIFIARNGTPRQNMKRVMDMMGGIERYIRPNDIVVLKPNCQWWNQGRTNLEAMKAFIELVLAIPGFSGEVIVAENNHFMDPEKPPQMQLFTRGWIKYGEINNLIDGQKHTMLTMIESLRSEGHKNVSAVAWRDGGPKKDIWGNSQNGGVVESWQDGDGYVWTDEVFEFKGFMGLKTWKVKMSYPVFTSPYSNITIDFKNGAFERKSGRRITDRRVRFVNFAGLCDHGADTGITSAVKNYMGITDLSCGYWGLEPQGYANVHFVGESHYTYARAGVISHFMKTIRTADLNIVTAEWVGFGHRTDVARATRARSIYAGTDPYALDYYGAKHLILPFSKNTENHDPDDPASAVGRFLRFGSEIIGHSVLDDRLITVHES
ncbi:MAG: hypothetical protein ACOC41_06785 [Chitinivibrionales bacterium]